MKTQRPRTGVGPEQTVQDAVEYPVIHTGKSDGTMEQLKIFRLVPIAEPNDPRWDNSPYQGEVVVRARSAADARLVASEAEKDFLEIDAALIDDASTRMWSAFREDKLYTVIEDESGAFPAQGPRAVLHGRIDPNVVKPLQM